MEKNIYEGLLTALITPFSDDKVDQSALEQLITHQIKAGVKALVIGGSTGEGSSLMEDEYYELISMACNIADKKIDTTDTSKVGRKTSGEHAELTKVSEHIQIPKFDTPNLEVSKVSIIAGFTAISTMEAVEKVKNLNKSNIDGIMCTVPHYIRPQQDGLVEHFKAISDNTNLPLMIYIHPGRTGVDLSDNSITTLSKCRNIVSIKDASGDMERPLRLKDKLPTGFSMLTGDDSNALAYSAGGGKGCVSVIANILPLECLQLQYYLANSDYVSALQLQQKLMPVYKAVFKESNPIGIKCAAYLMNLIAQQEIRLPLTWAKIDTENAIKEALREFKKV